MKLTDILADLMSDIASDSALDQELKKSLIDAINAVMADPTPGNLEALSVALGSFADTTRFVAVLEELQKTIHNMPDDGSSAPTAPTM